uniref:Nipped-B protein n=1 Tax=Macrostomum lignano TaxID=282301 RepID=A0A1I8GDV5_9PLAT
MIGNGGIPIQSLAGITSLTDILPELPLPRPVQSSLSRQQSLYYSQRVGQQAEQQLAQGRGNMRLLESIGWALTQTDTSSIELKSDQCAAAAPPALFQAVLAQNTRRFEKRPEFALYCQSLLANGAGGRAAEDAGVGGGGAPPVSGSATSGPVDDAEPDQDQEESGKREKHRHKKKKRKKERERRSSSSTRDDTNETNPSTSTTPSGASGQVTVVSREGIKIKLKLPSPVVKPIRIENPASERPAIVSDDVAEDSVAAVGEAADAETASVSRQHKKEKRKKHKKDKRKRNEVDSEPGGDALQQQQHPPLQPLTLSMPQSAAAAPASSSLTPGGLNALDSPGFSRQQQQSKLQELLTRPRPAQQTPQMPPQHPPPPHQQPMQPPMPHQQQQQQTNYPPSQPPMPHHHHPQQQQQQLPMYGSPTQMPIMPPMQQQQPPPQVSTALPASLFDNLQLLPGFLAGPSGADVLPEIGENWPDQPSLSYPNLGEVSCGAGGGYPGGDSSGFPFLPQLPIGASSPHHLHHHQMQQSVATPQLSMQPPPPPQQQPMPHPHHLSGAGSGKGGKPASVTGGGSSTRKSKRGGGGGGTRRGGGRSRGGGAGGDPVSSEVRNLMDWRVRDKTGGASTAADGGDSMDADESWDSRLEQHNRSLAGRFKNSRRLAAQQQRGNMQNMPDYLESDDEDDGEGGGASKRQRRDSDEDFKVRLKGSSESRYPPIAKGNSDRPRERVKCGLGVNLGVLSTEELVASETFVHFKELVDQALDAVEDVDIKVLDDSDELPAELKIPSRLLSDLCAKANQMKAVGAMKEMPVDRLVRLLSLLLANIKDGAKLVPFAKPAEDAEDTEGRLWRELCMERVMRSVESSLTALIIMTSPGMPKQVFVEDVIERAVAVAKFQLNSTVYPEADPAYRKTSQHKATQQSIRSQRAKERGHGALAAGSGGFSGGGRPRALTHLLNRLVELVDSFAQLVDLQRLTDNAILAMSGLAVAPFFVENVENLQLSALRLCTSVFCQYEKHRQLILEDLFASLARLPSSKRSLRSFRLNSEESIQMLTALSLLLVQSVVLLPAKVPSSKDQDNTAAMALLDAYESAKKTAQVFLVVFLNKCAKKAEEQDYRAYSRKDLLLAVNKPEWPAAEMFLSLLGGLLVKQFADRSVDQALRVASLDYLGTVASRLRKDAVTSEMSEQDLDSLVAEIRGHSRGLEASGAGASSATAAPDEAPITKEERIVILQKAIVDYLNAEDVDASVHYAVRFYLAQWYKDCAKEVERTLQQQRDAANNDESAVAHESLDVLESRRTALLVRSCEFGAADSQQLASKRRLMSTGRSDAYMLDYEEACLVCRYLASMRPFSQSFDIYLSQILKVLNEQSVAVRTKAIKCLTAVVEVDPSVLERADIERTVHGRLLDNSTSVREACIELIGKFIIVRPQLTAQYYGMLSERILDTGISVRKRVIKIFRDICVEQPDFNKIPEMCVKMIRRVNDEEGIRKLVNEVFQAMWFSPVKESHNVKLLQKVMNITDVVAACKDQGYDWFEGLLRSLLKEEKEEKLRPVEKACRQIVDTLVANIMRLEEISSNNNQRLVACLCTLYMLTKIRPNLMVDHASTLQSYLKIKISSQQDNYVLHYVAKILELTVPLMEHPDEEELRSIEQEMVQLTMRKGMMVLDSAIACLSAVVNRVTHNYSLIRSCFNLFYTPIDRQQQENMATGAELIDPRQKPSILRGLYTVGLLLKYFDLESITTYETGAIMQRVFSSFMFFCSQCADPDVVKKSLMGLGFMCARHSHLLLQDPLKTYYCELIAGPMVSDETKTLVLKNLTSFLLEEEASMVQSDSTWKEHVQQESLKEMHDVQSGKASMVAQAYLDHVLAAFYYKDAGVRLAALTMVVTILRQGLIHPVKTVAHLISMQSDTDPAIRSKADAQLMEIEKHYPSFINMRALFGVRQSFQLQRVLRPGRVYADPPVAMNHHLYSMLRTNRMNRRVLLTSMLNLFDENPSQRAPLAELLYVADNLASFPYQVAEEPLFLIHHLDLLVSVAGSTLLTSIKDYLGFAPGTELPDGCTPEMLATRIPAHTAPVEDYLLHSRGIALLLSLKQYLKELYGISDSKVQNYSPSDSAKTWEKPLNRRSIPGFRPQRCLDYLASESVRPTTVKLAADILDFEDLMLTIDPNDAGGASGDEEGGGGGGGRAAAGTSSAGLLSGDTVSAKQLPYHPAVQRGLDLKVQLTRIDSGMAGPTGLQSEAADEAAVPVPADDDGANSDASSQGPRIKMPKQRKRRPAARSGAGARRKRKASVSEESEDSPSSDESDSLSD